jgi:hypothetical protein
VPVGQQFPPQQTPPGQALPQTPQLLASKDRSAHWPLQQDGVLSGQERPQPPQLWLSLCTSIQLPPQKP